MLVKSRLDQDIGNKSGVGMSPVTGDRLLPCSQC